MSTQTSPQPWGRTGGLLSACGVTGLGIWIGLDPDVILLRAVVSGVIVGLTIRIVTQAWRRLEQE